MKLAILDDIFPRWMKPLSVAIETKATGHYFNLRLLNIHLKMIFQHLVVLSFTRMLMVFPFY